MTDSAAHLLQLFHVFRLDVNNVERVVANASVPQVNAEVIRRQKGFIVAKELE
jgi:hypothetical protein